jgi:preprotein translocase subunit SecG
MITFIIILHIILCFSLIIVVLIQQGKGADMGAVFGGSSQTIFGSSGAGSFLGKTTAVIAILFMITSLILTFNSGKKTKSSIMENVKKGIERKIDNKEIPKNKGKLPIPKPSNKQ